MASGPRFNTPFFQALDQVGVTVPGALLWFWLTESDTPAPTYSNIGLTIANENPVEADDAGLFPSIFLNPALTYKVRLTGPDNGITPPFEFWTADPVKEAWPSDPAVFWDQPFEFLGGTKPAGGEVIGMYVAARPQRIFADFDGTSGGFYKAVGAVLTPPVDGNYDVRVFKNNNITDAVGFMTIDISGGFTFSTDDGLPIDLDASEFITFVTPALVDSVGPIDLAWTITGINL